jgi:hypothetical protein
MKAGTSFESRKCGPLPSGTASSSSYDFSDFGEGMIAQRALLTKILADSARIQDFARSKHSYLKYHCSRDRFCWSKQLRQSVEFARFLD